MANNIYYKSQEGKKIIHCDNENVDRIRFYGGGDEIIDMLIHFKNGNVHRITSRSTFQSGEDVTNYFFSEGEKYLNEGGIGLQTSKH